MLLMSFNLKSNRTKKYLVVIFSLILCAVALAVSFSLKYGGNKEGKMDFSHENARVFFLNMHKLDVDLVESRQIRIPDEFSNKYSEYSNIMKAAGYNLENYKGKNAILYTYQVRNDDNEFVRASLTVCNNELIAADIYLFEQGGFVKALNKYS